MCRLKILLTWVVPFLSTWCFARIIAEARYGKIITGSIHMKNTSFKKKKNQKKTSSFFDELEDMSHQLHCWTLSWTNCGWVPCCTHGFWTELGFQFYQSKPHRAKICRSYYIVRHRWLRTTLQFRTFLKAFLLFWLWKVALLLKLWISLHSLHFRAGL